jgi:Zn-dependent protease
MEVYRTGRASYPGPLATCFPANMSDAAIANCPQCGTQFGSGMTVCPGCGRLVHSDRLNTLAQAAREATANGDISLALANWREALALLPANSRQYEAIAAKIAQLGQDVSAGVVAVRPSPNSTRPAMRIATGAGAVGLMLWKLKALLFGLTKGTTLLTMLLSLGVYWTMWGWKFALGLVLSIYVHEMGHVIVLRRYGFKATAPMFIPGIGALIRLQQQVVNPREDAEIGLAGPIYGLGAAVVSLGLWLATKQPIFAAIAGVGAWINLFNLLPIGSLDGGRGFHALSRVQKFLAAATAAGAFCITSDGLILVLGLVCVGRAIGDKSDRDGSWKAAITYMLLVLALAALSTVRTQAGVGGK